MKYKDITKEQARQICRKHRVTCSQCPLRRERTDKKGTKHTLFCYYILVDIFEDMEEIREEEIENLDQLKKE